MPGKIIKGNAKVTEEQEVPKSKLQEFMGMLFAENDLKSIVSYAVKDAIIPAFKKGASEAIKGSVDMIFYGHGGAPSSGRVQKIEYSSRFDSGRTSSSLPAPRPKFGSLVLDSREDCEVLLRNMQFIIDRVGVVRVLEMYDMAGYHTDMYTANKFGWSNISTAEIVRVPDGWELRMPNPMPIE